MSSMGGVPVTVAGSSWKDISGASCMVLSFMEEDVLILSRLMINGSI